MRINRESYERLIQEDIAWLNTMPRTLERDHIIDVLEDSTNRIYGLKVEAKVDKQETVEFKAGDRVCYKSHPNICIGYVSSDINFGNFSFICDNVETILIPIHTSGAWAEHFGHGACPNSMRVNADKIMLYTDDEK